MKKVIICLLMGTVLLAGFGTTWADVQTDIEKAGKAGKYVFLVVTEPGVTGAEKVLSTVKQALKSVPKTTVIEMNRADAANTQLVAKYRITGMPLPFILLIASNGMPASFLPADMATPERLVQMIPSPKKEEVTEALNKNKTAFVVASRKSMSNRNKVFDTCKAACSQMKDRAVFISIDMDDKQELSFLQKLSVNMASTEPVTFVVNPRGQITGLFNGPVEVAGLIQASAKQAGGGCCPPGSNKTCALPANTSKGKQK
jgi:hypothetical protein